MGLVKIYLCKCGESDPTQFYKKYKGVCKKCTKIRKRKWESNNIEKITDKRKEWYNNNLDHISNYNKEYYKRNKQRLSDIRAVYSKTILRKNAKYKVCQNIRTRHRKLILGKISTSKYLGCNAKEFRSYIESKFESWMSWNNYGYGEGKWVLDHIIPVSTYKKDVNGNFDYNSEYNQRLLHYTNLQPLEFIENLKKSDKLL